MRLSTVPLRHVAEVKVSNVDKKSVEGEQSVRLCNYTHVYYGSDITAEIEFMPATATARQIRQFSLTAGDVIITKDSETASDIGVAAYVPAALPGVVCGYHLALLRPRPNIHSRFLFWAVQSDSVREQWAVSATGVTRYGLNYDAMRSTEIPLPPLEEQRRIANYLDDQTTRIDQAIQLKQALVEKARLRHLALAQRITTTGLGGESSYSTSPTGISWMPRVGNGWQLLRLGQVFDLGSGATPPTSEREFYGGDIPWVNTGDLRMREVRTATKSLTELALVSVPGLRLYEPGALIVAMYGQGSTKGEAAVLKIKACVNQACCVMVPRGSVTSDWAQAWFVGHKRFICELAQGAGQPNLNQEVIASLRIPAPPQAEQMRLLEVVANSQAAVDALVQSVDTTITLLKERRNAVISAAVLGGT